MDSFSKAMHELEMEGLILTKDGMVWLNPKFAEMLTEEIEKGNDEKIALELALKRWKGEE